MRKCNRCGKTYPHKHKIGPCKNIVGWFSVCQDHHTRLFDQHDKPKFCNKPDCQEKIISWSPIRCTGFILKE